MAAKLKIGQTRLETTTKVTLGVLALASGVYTYLGVRGLLDGDARIVFFGAMIDRESRAQSRGRGGARP